MIGTALRMLIELSRNVPWLQISVDAGLRIAQKPIDVVDALAAEPAGIGGAETLFGAARHVRRNQPAHRIPQDQLAIAGFLFVAMALAHIILIDSRRAIERSQLQRGG